ncbi:hypothetical protein GCM10007160_00030 [Litchfieldella qijiaojingensis]|uniref:Peptidoglycan binding-like domain-containing protein n=2 Tax=Litchfieldella qijiaojingensis TaxID=980347 RepID=A0ABQ2YAB4_9GAMM|nr:hypothetical protein GCM10007160_00030 [Halomonas qijiaojingensis]
MSSGHEAALRKRFSHCDLVAYSSTGVMAVDRTASAVGILQREDNSGVYAEIPPSAILKHMLSTGKPDKKGSDATVYTLTVTLNSPERPRHAYSVIGKTVAEDWDATLTALRAGAPEEPAKITWKALNADEFSASNASAARAALLTITLTGAFGIGGHFALFYQTPEEKATAAAEPHLTAQETMVPNSSLCKAGIATIMGRNPRIMNAQSAGEITYISYTRDDGNSYTYKCKIEGNRIHWGNKVGRWRVHSADSKVFYQVAQGKVHVEDRFSDGSSSNKSFSFAELGYSPHGASSRRASQWSDLVLETQKHLNQLGFDAGPEDGIIGDRTRGAIKRFQQQQSLPANGEPSESLLDKLRAAAGS